MGDSGCGQHTDQRDIGPFGTDAGHQRGLEHRTRAASVAPDEEGLVRTEHPCGGPTERGHELDSELLIGDAADAVGTEAQGHDGRAMWLSASSIAAPYEPS